MPGDFDVSDAPATLTVAGVRYERGDGEQWYERPALAPWRVPVSAGHSATLEALAASVDDARWAREAMEESASELVAAHALAKAARAESQTCAGGCGAPRSPLCTSCAAGDVEAARLALAP